MKLATLKAGGRDGTLVVVSHDLKNPLGVIQIGARTLERTPAMLPTRLVNTSVRLRMLPKSPSTPKSSSVSACSATKIGVRVE